MQPWRARRALIYQMERSDQELVEAFLRSRDEGAFRDLYQRYSSYLFGLAINVLGRARSEAIDVLQETWLRAARDLSRMHWKSSLRTWLAGIAINCCREAARRGYQMREDSYVESDLEILFSTPQHSHAIDLKRAMSNLPDGYRIVLVLHGIYGFSHEEIADLLDIDAGTSKSQLSRGRRLLRSSLPGYEWRSLT